MRAIPKKLLIHNLNIYEEVSTKDWDSKKLKKIGDLKRVRIEHSSKIIRDKNNAEIQLAAFIVFDCRNSLTSKTLKEDMIIGFNYERYRVVSIESMYDESRLHHYELELVRYAG